MNISPLTLRISLVAAAMLITLATPMILRPDDTSIKDSADEVLVIISPHNETIRKEFTEAFRDHIREKRGKEVYIDWRTPGGTSEIRRVIDGEFAHAEARGMDGIGMDLFFGGGSYDFKQVAKLGHLAPMRLFNTKVELLLDGTIPFTYSGEDYYDPNGLWVGTCLSSFGIVYNTDVLKSLGIENPPTTWDDLADPRYFGRIALADPTKSGSANKAFEVLLQQKIQEALAELPDDAVRYQHLRGEAIKTGWKNGLNLIQRIGANARYFTDSASKIPLDVAQGNAAAGMSIDFYGRTLSEQLRDETGASRVQFVTPVNGSSISVDPIAIFRGSPNRNLAEEFVEFVLSKKGQKLWNYRAGTEGGTENSSLRRLPIRRDLYTPGDLANFSDPEALPYERETQFEYKYELTGRAFSSIGVIIKAMCLDAHSELAKAMNVINRNDNPGRAEAALFDVSRASYHNANTEIRNILKSDNKIEAVKLSRNLTQQFRENYRRAQVLATRGQKNR